MRICVYGVGAIGGHVAARLAAAQADEVSVVARGAVLHAIRERGLTLNLAGREISGKPHAATDDPATLPPQDLVVVALKAPALPAVAAAIAALLTAQGCALFLVNGIPWWWRHGLPGTSGALPLLDPDSSLWTKVRPERALGSIVYSANTLEAPGIISQSGHDRWIIGEPDGSSSARLSAVVAAFSRAGFSVQPSTDIHREVWRKLVVTASGNPVSALARLNFFELGADPGTRQIMASLMRETLAVAAVLGYDLHAETDVEVLSRRANTKPDQRPHSMLWDVLMNRPRERDALLGQTRAFARDRGIPVPTIEVILALLRGLEHSGRLASRAGSAQTV